MQVSPLKPMRLFFQPCFEPAEDGPVVEGSLTDTVDALYCSGKMSTNYSSVRSV